jgi:hypothetical protein
MGQGPLLATRSLRSLDEHRRPQTNKDKPEMRGKMMEKIAKNPGEKSFRE